MASLSVSVTVGSYIGGLSGLQQQLNHMNINFAVVYAVEEFNTE